MSRLKVFQIYFDESQIPLLEKEYIPFFNDKPTLYLESQVIADLVTTDEHIGSDYFAVVSHKLREKIGPEMKDNWRNHPKIANPSVKDFTPEQFEAELEKHRPDVLSFQCHMPHDTIQVADRFHPGFQKHWEKIMHEIAYEWTPTRFEDVFYCQFFAAKSAIYESFVSDMLLPAMRVMDTMPELMLNANYNNTPFPEYLKKKYNVENWTFHPFICERMFSWYAHKNKLKCLHY